MKYFPRVFYFKVICPNNAEIGFGCNKQQYNKIWTVKAETAIGLFVTYEKIHNHVLNIFYKNVNPRQWNSSPNRERQNEKIIDKFSYSYLVVVD